MTALHLIHLKNGVFLTSFYCHILTTVMLQLSLSCGGSNTVKLSETERKRESFQVKKFKQ
jgi:hypothetical protein